MLKRPFAHALLPLATALVLAAGVFLGAPDQASAQSTPITVHVVVASSGDGGVDAGLSAYGAQLTSRFSQFSSFSLEGTHDFALDVGGTESVPAVGGDVQVSLPESGRVELTMPGGITVNVGAPPGTAHFQLAGPAGGGTLLVIIETG